MLKNLQKKTIQITLTSQPNIVNNDTKNVDFSTKRKKMTIIQESQSCTIVAKYLIEINLG